MLFWLTRFFSSRAYHVRAFEEVFVVSVFSIAPIGLLPFITSLKADARTPFDLEATIWAAISSGQLFLYSFAMFGMIIWLSVEDVTSKPFPPRKYFIVVAVLAAFLCMLVYETDPTLSRPLNPVIVKISIWVYCGYIAMYYALLVFKMARAPSVDQTVDADVGDLISRSRKTRVTDHD